MISLDYAFGLSYNKHIGSDCNVVYRKVGYRIGWVSTGFVLYAKGAVAEMSLRLLSLLQFLFVGNNDE